MDLNVKFKFQFVAMSKVVSFIIFLLFSVGIHPAFAQKTDSLKTDSLHQAAENSILQGQKQQQLDSLIRIQLQNELVQASGDKQKTNELEAKLREIAFNDSIRRAVQLEKIEKLKKTSKGFPVAPFGDTLFVIYNKIGSFTAKDRATAISMRMQKLYEDPFYNADSLTIIATDEGYDILYNQETLVLSVTNLDALWIGRTEEDMVKEYLSKIKTSISSEKQSNSLKNWLKRLALVALIVIGLWILISLINYLFRRLSEFLNLNKQKYFRGLTIQKLQILSPDKSQKLALQANNLLRIVVIIFAVYLSLPLLFSIFPETETWRDILLNLILTPVRAAFNGILNFLPDLITILVIFFIFRYTLKGLKYFVNEIEKGNIHLKEFPPEWSQPTFNIVRFMLYAFMLVLIFPYLPGSGSPAFQGVSVFIGILFSLGSSSAISNMIAGLVITYMRPFKIGDRIRIGDTVGDVIEKTMLVTRIRTIKNEEITVPNSTVLSSNTINYSTNTNDDHSGLILYTTITIGYDVPWKDVHQALISAALRTDLLLKEPQPFVLQTSLDDFYVSYQINAYTRNANSQANIYSQLHQNIQDSCNEAGIEILSPHYRSARDGNRSTIPQDYLPKDYKAPAFDLNIKKESK